MDVEFEDYIPITRQFLFFLSWGLRCVCVCVWRDSFGGNEEAHTVEELVRHKVNGAVYVFLQPKEEFERAPRFVADRKRYVL